MSPIWEVELAAREERRVVGHCATFNPHLSCWIFYSFPGFRHFRNYAAHNFVILLQSNSILVEILQCSLSSHNTGTKMGTFVVRKDLGTTDMRSGRLREVQWLRSGYCTNMHSYKAYECCCQDHYVITPEVVVCQVAYLEFWEINCSDSWYERSAYHCKVRGCYHLAGQVRRAEERRILVLIIKVCPQSGYMLCTKVTRGRHSNHCLTHNHCLRQHFVCAHAQLFNSFAKFIAVRQFSLYEFLCWK